MSEEWARFWLAGVFCLFTAPFPCVLRHTNNGNAVRMRSDGFLPRDAIRKHGTIAVSVRLSVTLVYCIETAKDVIKHFPGLVAPSLYTVVQKNASTLADYNYDPVQSISVIFSKLFANDHKRCLVVKFSTSPHICCHYTSWNTMLYFALK